MREFIKTSDLAIIAWVYAMQHAICVMKRLRGDGLAVVALRHLSSNPSAFHQAGYGNVISVASKYQQTLDSV